MIRYFFLFALVFSNAALAQSTADSLLNVLDSAIEKRTFYVDQKKMKVDVLKAKADRKKGIAKFYAIDAIYEEYKAFIYDSAFAYALHLQQTARELNHPVLLNEAKIKMGFALVSSGLFNEALDSLRMISSDELPDSLKVKYYDLMARTCYDLADFSRDNYYGRLYGERGTSYIDSAMNHLDEKDILYYLLNGLKLLHMRDMESASKYYEAAIRRFNLKPQEYAIAASTLSFIYFYSDRKEQSKEMLIRAAIADIRSCTKETIATMNLAERFLQEGDVTKAYKYIKVASEDAEFYGARQRKVQVAAIYPVIEARQLAEVEGKRKMLLIYSSLITLLMLSVIGFSIVIYKQNKKLQKARRIISKANENLTFTNHQLQDANKIKEEYIWYYFNTTADYISKLDALKKTLDLKLMTKKLEDIRFAVDNINIKREREELYHNFDKTFLKLFPNFVEVFNSLFKPEDQIQLKDGQLLNTELRIFALIRMGVHDHEKIAKILDYSVTTIYTYKTRIRNKSTVPSEDFDKHIMSIRAI